MKKVVLRISGVTNIDSCVRIEKMLKKNPNIQNATMDLKENTITILCKDAITIDEIEIEIDNLGYESLGVELFSNEKKTNIIPLIVLGIILLILFYLTIANNFHLPLYNVLKEKTRLILLGGITIAFLIYGLDLMWKGLKANLQGRSILESLVLLSILASSIFGFINLVFELQGKGSFPNYHYLEVTIFLIYFMKIGQYIDNRNRYNLEVEISQLAKTKMNKVNRKEEDTYKEVNIEEVRQKDQVLCLPGDKVLLDGVLVSGSSHFDESLITGESTPVEKTIGSNIQSGSINYENEIEYSVEREVKDSTISDIKKQVVEELHKKGHSSKRIDRVCNYLVPLAIIISIIIAIVNYMFTKNIYNSATKAVTILILSCPFGFALATPLSFQKQITSARKKKILIKKMETLEQARRIDTIVFDKTGTLTNGFLSIARFNNHSDYSDRELLELLGSIEKHSTHALARGITKYLRGEKITSSYDFITEDLPGYGVKAKDNENIYYACNSELLDKLDIINSYKEEERKLKLEGNYVIYLTKNNKVIATFGLKDIPKKETKKVINSLQERNIEIILLTGDDEITANKIAKELDINKVVAGMNASKKVEYLKQLKKEGKKVIMVGDGLNDAPSIAASTIGISIKNASDIPTIASDVILETSNLFKIIDLFLVSKNMLRYVKQNIIISMLVSLVGLIITLGVIPGIKMNAVILTIGMFISSLLVILNTIRIKNK